MRAASRPKVAARTPAPGPDGGTADLLVRIRSIWEAARTQAARSVNTAHVCASWLIGQQIVEAEQGGDKRAGYGKGLLKTLSQQLSSDSHPRWGVGFSVSALQYMRAFYLAYPELMANQDVVHVESVGPKIQHALRVESPEGAGTRDAGAWRPGVLHAGLAWTHYRALLKVVRREARDFYEIEAVKNAWSARQLERQMASLLFERLAKSRDKQGLLALASEGLEPTRPAELIKDPYVLEFLSLPESPRLNESTLEEALISQLQAFLLELGSGFAFIGRQQRLTLDGDHFYPDLVFYQVRLKCYVIIDLKVGKLDHADLGQMQLYVNWYDQVMLAEGDNPSIGLILCTEKNDAVVRYVLAERSRQIFASRYQLYLPTEAQLQDELRRELAQVEHATSKPAPPAKKGKA
jgi:predicted nuclease of restriction endonuclease-like (RecB) superfamily